MGGGNVALNEEEAREVQKDFLHGHKEKAVDALFIRPVIWMTAYKNGGNNEKRNIAGCSKRADQKRILPGR